MKRANHNGSVGRRGSHRANGEAGPVHGTPVTRSEGEKPRAVLEPQSHKRLVHGQTPHPRTSEFSGNYDENHPG